MRLSTGRNADTYCTPAEVGLPNNNLNLTEHQVLLFPLFWNILLVIGGPDISVVGGPGISVVYYFCHVINV